MEGLTHSLCVVLTVAQYHVTAIDKAEIGPVRPEDWARYEYTRKPGRLYKDGVVGMYGARGNSDAMKLPSLRSGHVLLQTRAINRGIDVMPKSRILFGILPWKFCLFVVLY